MFAIVFKYFSRVFFASVSEAFSSVSSVFRRMLQMFHLDVSKVDRVLYLPPRLLLPRLDVFSFSWHRLGISAPPSLLDASDVQGGMGPVWAREMARKGTVYPGVRALVSPFFSWNKKEVLAERISIYVLIYLSIYNVDGEGSDQ